MLINDAEVADMSRYRKKNHSIVPWLLILLVAVVICACYQNIHTGFEPVDQYVELIHGYINPNNAEENNTHQVAEPLSSSSLLQVYFIDVGQADCTFARQGNHTLLIDSGNIEDGPLVAQYLTELGVDHIDLAIITHANEDHCGGMDSILYSIPCRKLILPNRDIESWVYQSSISAAQKTGTETHKAVEGESFMLGNASLSILRCDIGDPENLNESSIVCRLNYGDIDFMLTGDAEAVNEAEILQDGYTVESEILKAGHHGSNTSNTYEWIHSVSPEITVISAGKGNDYGLPSTDVLNRFSSLGIRTMRTDESGTIIVETDGAQYYIYSQQTNTDAA